MTSWTDEAIIHNNHHCCVQKIYWLRWRSNFTIILWVLALSCIMLKNGQTYLNFLRCSHFCNWKYISVDALNLCKTFISRPERSMNVLCTFHFGGMFLGQEYRIIFCKCIDVYGLLTGNLRHYFLSIGILYVRWINNWRGNSRNK